MSPGQLVCSLVSPGCVHCGVLGVSIIRKTTTEMPYKFYLKIP